MGILVSQPLHYRDGDSCQASVAIADNAPAYTIIDLASVTVVAGDIVHVRHVGVTQDPVVPSGTDGTWHYPGECIDA